MSEDPETNKKCDGECAPALLEVSSVKVHEKESLYPDITGGNGEPDKSSREIQHTAGDVSENTCPDEESLPGVKQTPGNLGCKLSDITLGGATGVTAAAISIAITLRSMDVNLQPPSAHPSLVLPTPSLYHDVW
ncbi:hypothetical protein HispidOSU_001034 [Sigmodon hispidus]